MIYKKINSSENSINYIKNNPNDKIHSYHGTYLWHCHMKSCEILCYEFDISKLSMPHVPYSESSRFVTRKITGAIQKGTEWRLY